MSKFWAALNILALLVLASWAGATKAAPSVVADICDAKCDQCVWGGLGGSSVSVVVVNPTQGNPTCANRICQKDVAAAVVGSNAITIACRDSTSVWGDSVTVPFSFVRPPPPTAPASLRVAPL